MRKLRLSEVMKLSKILREIDITSYMKTINFQALKDLNKDDESSRVIKTVIMTDIIAYVVSNLDKAETTIYELISSYTNKTIEESMEIDVDYLFCVLEDMFKNGLPEVIRNLLKIEDKKKSK